MLESIEPQVLYEVEELETTKQGLTSYECPCKTCHGGKVHNQYTIKGTFASTWARPVFPMAYGGM
jgi:hypothetical protein